MNLLERVLTLLRANVNSMVEKADDPDKVLRQLQLDMRNQLVQVKTQVATAIAESHRLQQRSKERATEAESWFKRAEQAIQQHNDDVARSALARYNDMLKQAGRYQQQQKEQEQLVTTMRGVLRQLEAKIAEVETTIDVLMARKRNALIQQRVYDALNKSGTGKTGDKERAAKAQDAVLEAEARARALAELHKHDLDTQLDQLSQEQFVERQMDALKAKHSDARSKKETPLLPEGNPQPSPLLPPEPHLTSPATSRIEGKENNAEQETRLTPDPSPYKLPKVDMEQLKKLMD